MAQVFRPRTNTLVRVTLLGLVIGLAGLAWVGMLVNRSGYVTWAGVAREQPVPFSHKHHAGELGIDCRYCHTSVEKTAFAGIPPTKTCMNCHAQIWADSPMLEPVRASFRTDQSLHWTRVHDLPDFVYFNHSIHVNKGVGCVSCHGRIDTMNLTYQVSSLQMEWCVGCHRDPAPNLRPREEIFSMTWEPPGDRAELGRRLMKEYGIEAAHLTNCSTCHR